MIKHRFFPDTLAQQILWLKEFSININTFAAKYGLTPAALAALQDDIASIIYWFQVHELLDSFSQSVTAYLNEVKHGVKPGHTGSAVPTLPVFDAPPTEVQPGALVRVMAIANGIKVNVGYNEADGEALGLEGAEVVFNPNEGKPDLTGKRTAGGLPLLHVTKGHYEGYEIWKITNGVYAKYDRSTHADYIDHIDLPAIGQIAIEKYKAKYLYKGEAVGEWSEEVSVTIYGSV